jgi:hypothetical protein
MRERQSSCQPCRRCLPAAAGACLRLPAAADTSPLFALQDAPPQQCLAELQRLLVQYETTLPAAALFRPVLLKAVAGLVVGAADGIASGQQPSAELAVALLSVLELAPHTEG